MRAQLKQKWLTLTVAAALSIETSKLASGQVGVAYPGASLASSGGTAPVTWAVTAPNGATDWAL